MSGPGAFSQRSDAAPAAQPVRVPTGQPYGQAKQVENAQQAVPLPQGGPGQVALPPGQGRPAPGQGGPPSPLSGPPGQPLSPHPQAQPAPGNILDLLSHQTQRPNESPTQPAQGLPGKRTVPLQQIIQTFENIFDHSDTVPENVMRLYQQLRQEAANQGPSHL